MLLVAKSDVLKAFVKLIKTREKKTLMSACVIFRLIYPMSALFTGESQRLMSVSGKEQ